MQKETRTTSSSGAQKGVKPWAYDKLPPKQVELLAELYGLGAQKYAEHNFRKGYEWGKTYAALQRHANLFWSGEDVDLELGSHHLINVAWHAVAATEFQLVHPEFDTRTHSDHAELSHTTSETIQNVEHIFSHTDLRAEVTGVEPRFDLIPLQPLARLSILYGEELHPSLQNGEAAWSSLYSALQYHIHRWWGGETYHAESGHLHTVWAIYYAFELHRFADLKLGSDNRLIEGAAPIGYNSRAS